jgi:hypothetical protein
VSEGTSSSRPWWPSTECATPGGQRSLEDLEYLVDQTRKDFKAQADGWTMLRDKLRTALLGLAALLALGLSMLAVDPLVGLLDAGATGVSARLVVASCLVVVGCLTCVPLLALYWCNFQWPPPGSGANAQDGQRWLKFAADRLRSNERAGVYRTRGTAIGALMLVWQVLCVAQYATYKVIHGGPDATGMRKRRLLVRTPRWTPLPPGECS